MRSFAAVIAARLRPRVVQPARAQLRNVPRVVCPFEHLPREWNPDRDQGAA